MNEVTNINDVLGKIINGDCIGVMKNLPTSSIDLVVTSPPYNCNIPYDVHKDDLIMDEYWDWTREWLTGVFDLLKDDGRVAINIPYETNVQERGGRCLFVSDFWQIMKQVGFKFFENDKKEFMELVFGQWTYLNDSRPITKATFSMDIPTKAIKILTFKGDIVLDPFAGSGTSLVAAEILDRNWLGIELSPNYAEKARERVGAFVLEKRQKKIEFENF